MINLDPAVGRIVMTKPTNEMTHPNDFIGDWGTITKIAGQRIVYESGIDHKQHYTYKVACVCDTRDEVERVLEFNRKAYNHLMEMKHELQAAFNAMFGAVK